MYRQSPYGPLHVPEQDIWNFLFENQKHDEDHELFVTDDLSVSYNFGQTKRLALDFAQALQEKFAWRKHDVLAVVAGNSVHTASFIWGALRAGGIVSPANPTYSERELLHQLRDTRPSAILTQQELLPKVKKTAQAVGLDQSRILLLPSSQPASDFIDVQKWCANMSQSPKQVLFDPTKDGAYLVYSSGTTGLPKGVLLTHRNIVANILQIDAVSTVHAGDTVLACLPFFHIYGLTVLLHHPFFKKARVVVLERYTLPVFARTVAKMRVSVAYIVPPIAAEIVQSPQINSDEISSLRYMVSGAAPLSEELIDQVYTKYQIPTVQGYGMSEASPGIFMQAPNEFQKGRGSVGRLLPGVEAILLTTDNGGKTVVREEEGEICIRGPNVFQGYFNNEAATKHCFTSDGFFRTGDIGFIDSHGFLRVTGRIKELIKYKGYQVAPAELENLFLAHPDVADVCVIGVEDPAAFTEVPRAYIVRTSKGKTVTASGLQHWLNKQVANHKHLRGGVVFLDQLPRSASGKLLRKTLQEMGDKRSAKL